VRRLIERQIAQGARSVKLMASGGGLTPGTTPHAAELPLELMRAAVETARAHGVPVTGQLDATTRRALEAIRQLAPPPPAPPQPLPTPHPVPEGQPWLKILLLWGVPVGLLVIGLSALGWWLWGHRHRDTVPAAERQAQEPPAQAATVASAPEPLGDLSLPAGEASPSREPADTPQSAHTEVSADLAALVQLALDTAYNTYEVNETLSSYMSGRRSETSVGTWQVLAELRDLVSRLTPIVLSSRARHKVDSNDLPEIPRLAQRVADLLRMTLESPEWKQIVAEFSRESQMDRWLQRNLATLREQLARLSSADEFRGRREDRQEL